jgi:hypothetical protein
MLSLANMFDLLMDELTGCGGRGLAFPKIFFCTFFGGFFWHSVPPSASGGVTNSNIRPALSL